MGRNVVERTAYALNGYLLHAIDIVGISPRIVPKGVGGATKNPHPFVAGSGSFVYVISDALFSTRCPAPQFVRSNNKSMQKSVLLGSLC